MTVKSIVLFDVFYTDASNVNLKEILNPLVSISQQGCKDTPLIQAFV